jgi:ribosome-associated heat shock protein Hsp15
VEGQRLDKWLWCVRLVKTRTLSATLIEAGKVRVNGQRVRKTARPVVKGDIVTASLGRRVVVVRVLGSVERRVAASLARTLYQDLTPPPVPQEGKPVAGGCRPTKRDRRRLDAFVSQG